MPGGQHRVAGALGLLSLVAGCVNARSGDGGALGSGCRVLGVSYRGGAEDPGNPCSTCQPDVTTSSFTAVHDARACGNAGAEYCQSGQCAPGCLVDGAVYAAGSADPAHACQHCDPSVSGDSFQPFDGLPGFGECPSAHVCIAGGCADGCFIEGTALHDQTIDPANNCLSCQSHANPWAWSALGNGGPCGDGGACYLGTCQFGCVIDSTAYPSGAVDPEDSCRSCAPTQNLGAFSPSSGVAAFGVCDGGQICDVGVCRRGCWISGAYAAAGIGSSANGCLTCQPDFSLTNWTPISGPQPGACDAGGVCQQGSCRYGCFIDGALVAAHTLKVGDPSLCCGPLQSTATWTPDFIPGNAYDTGGGLFPVVADIDNDGRLDLAVTGGSEVKLYFGLGGELLRPATSGPFPAGFVSGTDNPLALGDLNGDLQRDIAVGLLSDGGGVVGVMLNRGDAGFGPLAQYPMPGAPAGAVIADFNGDGFADLAVSGTFGIELLLGDGSGDLTPGAPVAFDAGLHGALGLGDFSGHGAIDLVTLAWYQGGLSLLRNDGSGGFPTAEPLAAQASVSSFGVFDLDGDGRSDLVLIAYPGIVVLMQQSDGSFRSFNYASPDLASITSADINQDGHPDLIATDLNQGSLELLLNAGDATFLPFVTLKANVGYYPSVVAGRFGDDAAPDLAVFAYQFSTATDGVTLLTNGCR